MRLRLPPPLDVVKYQVIMVDFFASVQLILGGLFASVRSSPSPRFTKLNK
jgi:hypothetical protein